MRIRAVTKIFRIVSETLRNRISGSGAIYYVMDDSDWVIKKVGDSLHKYLCPDYNIAMFPFGMRNSIIHFGSIGTFFSRNASRVCHKSNKIVVTWYHVAPGNERVARIPAAVKSVDLWHTASNLTKEKLVELGIPRERILVIPLGVDLTIFNPPCQDEKKRIRHELNLSEDKIIVGSFQKDGNGWEEGLAPKLIKGPDVFCDVVERLSSRYNIHVLLTGPARGYVKKRLEEMRIPYLHRYLKNHDEIAKFYKAIDIYIVASRVEGLPIALLEGLASGVPMVTTRVGMAPDIIVDGVNGFIAEVEDVEGIVEKASLLIENKTLQEKVTDNGLATIKAYDWENIANQFREKMYQGLISN